MKNGVIENLTSKVKDSFKLCDLNDNIGESSSQDTLPYEEIYENGICHVKDKFYCKTVEFFDINYKLAPEEKQRNIFDGYCRFLNYFDEKISVQLSFINAKTDKKEVEDVIRIPTSNDDLAELKEEFSEMLKSQYSKGNSGIARKKYITFGIVCENLKDATVLLTNIETAVIANFKIMGVRTNPLSGMELLRVMYKIMHVGSKKEFSYEPKIKENKAFDGSERDAIAPSILDFTNKNSFRIGSRYASVSKLKLCCSDFDDSNLIEALSLDESMVITIYIHPVDMTKALKTVRVKLTGENSKKVDENKKALHGGYDMGILPPDLENNIDGCKNYYEGLAKGGEKLFYVSMGICTYGKSAKSVNISKEKVVKMFKNDEAFPLSSRQIDGFKSILPLCYDKLGKERTLLTTHIALMIPFTSQELFMKGESIYYGLNCLSNNMIMCDRKKLNNPNGLILGKPGAGKSFSTKREILNSILISDDDVIICDPEGEYHSLVQGIGGQVINISNKSMDHINPMDINLDVIYHPEIYDNPDNDEYEDEGTLIKDKFEFLCSFTEMVCCTTNEKGKTELTGEEISAVDIATKNVYEAFFANNPREENMPILEDFYNELSRIAYMEGRDARMEGIPENIQLASAAIVGKMRAYIKGSNDVFNHRTNINLNNRVICFNIRNLGSNLRKIGMFIIQNMVWTRVSANRTKKKYTRYYVDEFHLLLGQTQTAQYSVEIWKRFRKWGGIPTGITQNVKDLLVSKQVENIFSNSDFILMLSQAKDDREILAKRLSISEDQESYITDVGQGQGLIFFGGVIVPFIDKYPSNTISYKLMTTKITET